MHSKINVMLVQTAYFIC